MSEIEKLGFKSGLEIHQQLDVGKLFCNCPGYLRNDEPNFFVKRKMHKVAGESGEIDVAVEHEAGLEKEFVYQGYNDTTCLVELDEEPPHLINSRALDEVLKIALLLNCEIYQTTQIMRKMVIDGSNTSGFQRSVLVGHSGFIETSFGKVKIESVALEEDSARVIERDEKRAIYRLDRLGIPLVEIATAPEMKNPEQIKECALKIGDILRACNVKRGIGTIRQDVNVSIRGHERVEIKGFQEPKMMVRTVEKEIERQMDDLNKGRVKGDVRNALPSGETEFLRPMPGAARMYPETDLPLLKISREKINEIKKKLPKLRDEIKEQLRKKGVSSEIANLIVSKNALDEFETLMKVYGKNAELIGKMIVLWRKDEEKLNERVLEKVLEAVRDGKIGESDVRDVMKRIDEGDSAESALKIEKVSDDELAEEIGKIVKEKPGLSEKAYMGLVMKKFGGKVDAKKAMEILRKLIK